MGRYDLRGQRYLAIVSARGGEMRGSRYWMVREAPFPLFGASTIVSMEHFFSYIASQHDGIW